MKPAVARPVVILSAFAWVVVLLSASALALTIPAFTRALGGQLRTWETAGVSRLAAESAAEQVRAFVVGNVDDLPRRVERREAFDERAESHLRDVRGALSLARWILGASALALAACAGLALRRGGRGVLAGGMLWGAGSAAAVVGIAALAALVDFAAFFEDFHSVFFAEGSWLFDPDSLLIQLFPERFWAISAISWGVLTLFGAALLALGGIAFRRSEAAQSPK